MQASIMLQHTTPHLLQQQQQQQYRLAAQPHSSRTCRLAHARQHIPVLQQLPTRQQWRGTMQCVAAAAAAAQVSGAASNIDSQGSSDWRGLLLSKSLEPGQLVRLTLKAKIKGDQGLANIKQAPSTTAAVAAAAATAAAAAATATAAPATPATSDSEDAANGAAAMPYKQLTMRPVMLKGKVMLQVSLLTSRQDITKNFTGAQATTELAKLLQLPWQSAHLLTQNEVITVQVSRKGKALVQAKPNNTVQQVLGAGSSNSSSSSSSNAQPIAAPSPQQQQQPVATAVTDLFSSQKPQQEQEEQEGGQQQQPQQQQQVLISLQHDRVKVTPINGSVPDPFLQKIGLQTAEGRIKANMQAKFTQINEFLKLLSHSGELEHLSKSSSSSSSSSRPRSSSSRSAVHILDAGCGSSHLTFGTFHYLHNVLGLPVRLTGVDTNAALMQRSNRACSDLGIATVAQFHTAAIRDFPALGLPNPHIVLALHACDTATDEALAVGVLCGARIIMSVPCCQKDIHRQFQRQQQQQQQSRPSEAKSTRGGSSGGSSGGSNGSSQTRQVQQVLEPLLEHGILRQRQLDLVTDALRAQLLRLAGYRTDVVEFVSTEHTPRNLLIRAVRRKSPLPDAEAARLAQQYKQLRDTWGVQPHLEGLLRGYCAPWL